MASLVFIGAAQAVAQVEEIELGGTWADGDTVSILIGGKVVTYTCGTGETPTTVAAGLAALAAASQDPEFRDLTWTVDGAVIRGVSRPGFPATIDTDEDSASGTITESTEVDATGPHHWNDPANWSTGSVPTNGDEVFIEQDHRIRFGLPTSLSLDRLVVRDGELGLADQNEAGYSEYRPRRAIISCTSVEIGKPDTTGPRLCRLSTASAAANVLVLGSRQGGRQVPVDLILNNSSAVVSVSGGMAGIAVSGLDASEVGTVHCGANAQVAIGTGVTITTINTAGQLKSHSGATNINVFGGNAQIVGAAAATNLNVTGGSCHWSSTGTVTNASVGPGVINASFDNRPKTFTNATIRRGGSIADPARVLTLTNIIRASDVSTLQAV